MEIVGLILSPAAFAGIVCAGCWLASVTRPCLVCAEPLALRAWLHGICPACWTTWQGAVAGHYQEAWEAAYGRAHRRQLWGPGLRAEVERELRDERSRHERTARRAA